jgi:hypothetical protein
MEQAFYSNHAATELREVRTPVSEESGELDLESFIAKLRNAPPDKLTVLAELLRV